MGTVTVFSWGKGYLKLEDGHVKQRIGWDGVGGKEGTTAYKLSRVTIAYFWPGVLLHGGKKNSTLMSYWLTRTQNVQL